MDHTPDVQSVSQKAARLRFSADALIVAVMTLGALLALAALILGLNFIHN